MRSKVLGLSLMTLMLWAIPPVVSGAHLTHGPVVGGVTATEVKVFVRTNRRATVQTVYSVNPDLSGALLSGEKTTREKRDFTKQIKLSDLLPNTKYYYDVMVNGDSEFDPPYSTFTTFPPNGEIVPFQFIAMADHPGHYKRTGSTIPSVMPIYEAVAQETGARFMVQLGDLPHGNCKTLFGFRGQYKLVYAGESFSKYIGPRLPLFHTWDDHDYGKNDSDKTWEKKKKSLKAFKEYFPTPRLARPRKGVWHSFRFAQADFFVLDCRSQRDVASDPDDSNKSMIDGDNITDGQKEWLRNGLLNSAAKWKFVLSSVPFNPTAKPTDSWAAYLTERDELLNFIADNGIKNIIILSGDLHSGGRLDDGTNSGDPWLGVWIPEMSVPHSKSNYNSKIRCTGPCGIWSEGELTRTGGYGLITVQTVPARVILEIKDWEGNSRKNLVIDDQR